jgi:hypothetical protein
VPWLHPLQLQELARGQELALNLSAEKHERALDAAQRALQAAVAQEAQERQQQLSQALELARTQHQQEVAAMLDAEHDRLEELLIAAAVGQSCRSSSAAAAAASTGDQDQPGRGLPPPPESAARPWWPAPEPPLEASDDDGVAARTQSTPPADVGAATAGTAVRGTGQRQPQRPAGTSGGGGGGGPPAHLASLARRVEEQVLAIDFSYTIHCSPPPGGQPASAGTSATVTPTEEGDE